MSQKSASPLSVTACIIARDEEHHLPHCLRSIAGAVDQIVVVDTGSQDRTVEIARRAGALVFHFAWCDDFSAARNESLRHATSDWIIWIDADDELVQTEPNALRSLCGSAGRGHLGFWLNVVCPYTKGGALETTIRHWRLFPNRSGIRFHGRVHEQPAAPAGGGDVGPESQTRVFVRHGGYAVEAAEMAAKRERNRKLVGLALAEAPSDPANRYYLGQLLSADGDFAGALRELTLAIDLWEEQGHASVPYLSHLFCAASMSAIQLRSYEVAEQLLARAPHAALSPELLCSAGLACWRLGRYGKAKEAFNRAWQDPIAVANTLFERGAASWRPLMALAELHQQLGENEDAYKAARQAAAFAPSEPAVQLALAAAAGTLGRVQERYDVLDTACRTLPGNTDIRLALARLLKSHGCVDEALNVLATGIDQPDPPAELYQELATCLIKKGRYEDAVNAVQIAHQRRLPAKTLSAAS